MDNKPARRKLFHSQESLALMRAKRREKQQDTLDRVGYTPIREPRDYNSTSDYVSSLGL